MSTQLTWQTARPNFRAASAVLLAARESRLSPPCQPGPLPYQGVESVSQVVIMTVLPGARAVMPLRTALHLPRLSSPTCPHGVRLSCNEKHAREDDRLCEPLCPSATTTSARSYSMRTPPSCGAGSPSRSAALWPAKLGSRAKRSPPRPGCPTQGRRVPAARSRPRTPERPPLRLQMWHRRCFCEAVGYCLGRVRSGQAPAWPLVIDRSGRRGPQGQA